jgi:hypothetical protein
MIMFLTVSFIVGAALAQRFKVIVLMPAIVIFSGFSIVSGGAQAAWSIVLMVATTATCLQIGYFVGIYIRHVLESLISQYSNSLASSKTPARHVAR